MNKTAEKQSIWKKTFVREWVSGDQLTESVRLVQKPGYKSVCTGHLIYATHTELKIYDRLTPSAIVSDNSGNQGPNVLFATYANVKWTKIHFQSINILVNVYYLLWTNNNDDIFIKCI